MENGMAMIGLKGDIGFRVQGQFADYWWGVNGWRRKGEPLHNSGSSLGLKIQGMEQNIEPAIAVHFRALCW